MALEMKTHTNKFTKFVRYFTHTIDGINPMYVVFSFQTDEELLQACMKS